MTDKNQLPDASYGKAGDMAEDWRHADPGPDDDEELDETPADVVAMLGFDPLDAPGESPTPQRPGLIDRLRKKMATNVQ